MKLNDGSEMTRLDFSVLDADQELERLRMQLSVATGMLQDNLKRLQQRLETEGLTANINELGEVQGSGTTVDRLCALFKKQQEVCKTLRRLQGAVSP